MDDVSLKQKQTDDDTDLENLIFNNSESKELEQTTQRRDSDDDNEALDGPETEKPAAMQMQDSDSDESDATTKSMAKGADRSSLNNVLPVDKLKNGATTASKYVYAMLSLDLSIYLSIYLSIFLYLSIYLYISVYVSLSMSLL